MLGGERGGDAEGFFGNDWTGDYYKHLYDGEMSLQHEPKQHERTLNIKTGQMFTCHLEKRLHVSFNLTPSCDHLWRELFLLL